MRPANVGWVERRGRETHRLTRGALEWWVSLSLNPPYICNSRLDRKPQPPGLAQRAKIEGADLDRAADVDRDRDAILCHRGRDDPRPLRQQRGHVGVGYASLGLENTIAD